MGARQAKAAPPSVTNDGEVETEAPVHGEGEPAEEGDTSAPAENPGVAGACGATDSQSAPEKPSDAEDPSIDVVVTDEDELADAPAEARHGREVDELELAALNWRRFAGVGPSELVELVAIGANGIRVAYAKGENEYLRLLRDAERLPGVAGVYQVANQLGNRVRQLCRTGHWVTTARRASDAWVSERRVLPIDLDSMRPQGQSATDAEKASCYEAADKIETVLRRFVDPWAIGRGDSGNGIWLFIALQQVRCSKADDAQIAKLLKDLQTSFSSKHCKVDTAVSNASRLVPAFGTLKRKGQQSNERPHRRTTFSCFGEVRRVRLVELFG